MGQLYVFRPFQAARDIGKKAGIDPEPTFERIRKAQEAGTVGNRYVGYLREQAAARTRYSGPTDGEGT